MGQQNFVKKPPISYSKEKVIWDFFLKFTLRCFQIYISECTLKPLVMSKSNNYFIFFQNLFGRNFLSVFGDASSKTTLNLIYFAFFNELIYLIIQWYFWKYISKNMKRKNEYITILHDHLFHTPYDFHNLKHNLIVYGCAYL